MVGAGASKEPVTRSCLGKPQARECFLPKRESLPRAEIWSMVPCSRHKPAPLLKGQMAKIEATAPNHPQLQQESFCSLWYCSTLHEDFLREKDFLSPCNCYLQSSGKPYIPYFRKLVCKKKKKNTTFLLSELKPQLMTKWTNFFLRTPDLLGAVFVLHFIRTTHLGLIAQKHFVKSRNCSNISYFLKINSKLAD